MVDNLKISSIDLDSMELEELLIHQENIKKIIKHKQKDQREAAMTEMQAIAIKLGYSSLEEFLEARHMEEIFASKYRNPENPNQKWAGRGRKPKWVNEYLKGEGTLEDLLV